MSVARATLVLGSLEAFGPLSMDLYLPQLPQLAASLGTTDSLAQATMSACMIGLGLGQLITGPLSDRYGRKRPLLVGVILFTVLSVVCALAPTIEILLIARLLQGLAGSAGVVICLAVARDLYSGVELSRMLSMLALVTAIAPIVAPVLGGQLARVMDWRGIFGVLAGIGLLLLATAWFGLRETLPPSRRHSGAMLGTTRTHLGLVLRDPLFVTIMLASAAGGVAFFSYLSMSSFVVQDQYGLSAQAFSLVFAANAIALMFGAQISRLLVRRVGPLRIYLTGQSAGALSALVLFGAVLLGAPAIVVLPLLGFTLMSSGLGGPNGNTLALGDHGAHAGTASAVLGMSSFTVGALVAPLVSLGGVDAHTLAATMAAGSVVAALLGLLVVGPLARRRSIV